MPAKEVIKNLPYIKNIFKYQKELETDKTRLLKDNVSLKATIAELQQVLGQCEKERDLLEINQKMLFVPPGHFYSPITSAEEIKTRGQQIFNRKSKDLPGIDLNEQKQLELLSELKAFIHDWPYEENSGKNLRYNLPNDQFENADALYLFCMLRFLKPARMIEIGSGYSSALTLDTNELFLDNKVRLTFIEPYPQRLQSLLKNSEVERIDLIQKNLQDVPLEKFEELEDGDILFIDSTHVAKTGSDVNYLFFSILPRLKQGVYIHIHDVLFPFEYPLAWINQGRSWNEAYLLRAFLQYNREYSIVLFIDFLHCFHLAEVRDSVPPDIKNTSGGSVWLQKL